MLKHVLMQVRFHVIRPSLALVLFLLSGCVVPVASDTVYTVITSGTLMPGEAIPAPQDTVILTVSGKIGAMNQDDTIVMDQQTVAAVGVVEYEVHDPFENRPIIYRGVLMSELLKVWQVADDVTVARITALNDYQIDVPVEDFYQYPVLFAMQADGVAMTPDYRGPAMLVYPLDDFAFDLMTNKRSWIWQIKTVELQ
jgi:hypothetical protein